jgi:hypothetical protein
MVKLASTTTHWLGDGTFVVDGLLGMHRLTVRPSGPWFVQTATLEDATDIGSTPVNFAAGKSYTNVRVWMSDAAAEIVGRLREAWRGSSPVMIKAFPEDASLWQDDSPFVRTADVAFGEGSFSVKGVPPGYTYLVGAYRLPDPRDPQAQFKSHQDLLNNLAPGAVRIFVSEPGKFEVTLPPGFVER